MSDDYAKGAAAAAQDSPRNRLASRAFKNYAKHGFGLIPGAQNAEAEYIDGYKDTQRLMDQDRHRQPHVQVTSTDISSVPSTQGDSSMSGSSNYSPSVGGRVRGVLSSGSSGSGTSAQEQIALLEGLKSFLHDFQQDIGAALSDYEQKVAALDGELLKEIHTRFHDEELSSAQKLLNGVTHLIVDSSIPALERRIAQLEPLTR